MMRMPGLVALLLLAACSPSPRDRAAMRRLRFMEGIAENPQHFKQHDIDLLWAFYSLSEAASHTELKREARLIGERLAKRSSTADALGVPDPQMKLDLQRAVGRCQPSDFLAFDPTREPVPHDVPERCERCRSRNQRGVHVCQKCGTKLVMKDRWDILFDALITTYAGQRYGFKLGAGLAYTITHMVYVLNDYDRYKHQNADGSWGDVNEKDIYTRYHTTWTGIGSAPPHETLKERNDEASADRDRGVLSGDPAGRRGVSALAALLPFAGRLPELNAEALGG